MASGCRINAGPLWLAVRVSNYTWAFGIAFAMDQFWITLRFGPLCFDLAVGREPEWC